MASDAWKVGPSSQSNELLLLQVVLSMKNVLEQLASVIQSRPAEIQKYVTAYKTKHNGRSP
jgi:hypothetical protein